MTCFELHITRMYCPHLSQRMTQIFFVISATITHSLLHHFETVPNSKKLQTTTEIWLIKDFNPFPNKPWFLRVYSTSLLKTLWEKEKLLVTSNFSFSHSVFNPFGELLAIFIKFKIVVCKVFEIGRG